MYQVSGKLPNNELSPKDIINGAKLEFCCCIHKVKKRTGFTFLTVRTGRYTFLTVHNPKYCETPLKGVFEGVYVKLNCLIREEKRAENGLEITITDYQVLSKPCEKYSMPISDRVIDCAPEEIAENRHLSFRNPIERAPMMVSSTITNAFSTFMNNNGFLNIKTPKFTEFTLENEKNSFTLDYFGKNIYLSTDPSVYSQFSIAFFDRVYSVFDVFYAKKRNSPRLLNEYTVLNFEQAYVDTNDIIELETKLIKEILSEVVTKNEYELRLLNANIPVVDKIPVISFEEALKIVCKDNNAFDLDPTDEKRICQWAANEFGSEFVFVTKYPSEKRPKYYLKNETFSLLFRGMEISFGGKKVYDYKQLNNKNMPESFDSFIKYGMPPHGGVSIGLERFVMLLLGLDDIRKASLFPRDIHILRP